ncbi:Mrp/NBP35 family ATP-binding protein [Halalkalirubrum salinum]|uniref:Mrp/NBP35 family ATP-binding protein n=1 Tax=Halalkalirubrum salinum TaxID=2563889 RepID=UPI0010FBB91C
MVPGPPASAGTGSDTDRDGTDIVSQGLVGEITVDDGMAHVPLAFGAPYSPAETELAVAVREAIEAAGYEPSLSIDIDDDTPAADPNAPIVIAVSSGKGGVGKSTIAVNIAAGIADRGARVGLFDTDVYGPNIPRMLGVQGEPVRADQNQRIVPVEAHQMQLMSVGFLVDQDLPVIWRGSLVDQTLTELWHDVNWGPLDYLVVDLPPGTGDAQLTMLQQMPVMGSVVVTTPQDVALDNARKGVRLFDDHEAEVFGIVENMSAFVCPNCGENHEVFRAGGGSKLAEEFALPVLSRIPLDPAIGEAGEVGEPIVLSRSGVGEIFADLACDVMDQVGWRRRQSHAARADKAAATNEE